MPNETIKIMAVGLSREIVHKRVEIEGIVDQKGRVADKLDIDGHNTLYMGTAGPCKSAASTQLDVCWFLMIPHTLKVHHPL